MPDLWLIATVIVLGATVAVIGAPLVRRWIREDLAVALDQYRLLEHGGRILDDPPTSVRQTRATPRVSAANSLTDLG